MKIIAHLVRALLCLALFAGSSAQAGGTSLCCPLDFDGDGAVGGADLAVVLGAWGPTSPGAPGDLDGSGQVDGSDLAILLGSWGSCVQPCLKTQVVGTVEFGDGSAVPGAVVVTDRGGQGVSGADGSFGFEVEVAPGRDALTVTAIATVRGVTYSGTKLVSPIVLDGVTDAGALVLSEDAGCSGVVGWRRGFGLPGIDEISALAVYDDGSGNGPALYAGGKLTMPGGVPANYIARWNGTSWSPLGAGAANGVDGLVWALAVFDDGLGGGPALYAGGTFTSAGGVPANRVAKWNGTSWSSLGAGAANGANNFVQSLAVFDDGSGSGPALYAGGFFTAAGGVQANHVAKWNGTSWSSLGAGAANGVNSSVVTFAVFGSSGGVPALYVGGSFTTAGGLPATSIARWNGTSWSSLGAANALNGAVEALTVFDDGLGSGPALYAGGSFTTAGAAQAKHVAKWNGTSWSSLGTGFANGTDGTVLALQAFDDGSGGGPALYAGGFFTAAGNVAANRVAKWNGETWSSLGMGASNGLDGEVEAFAAFDDGSGRGPAIHVGGNFSMAGGGQAYCAAKWSGTSWSPLGEDAANGVDGWVQTFTVFDDGSAALPELYAAGTFSTAGTELVNSIAKWNGRSWSPIGAGAGTAVFGDIYALAVFDDGSGGGPALYAGGFFVGAGSVTANGIAKWNGTSWSSLGTGFANGVDGWVQALAVFDDGSGGGPALYAGGLFTTAGGMSANGIAKWNGTSWSPLGVGASNGVSDTINALAVFDDGSGSGPSLYAGGTFTTAGGVQANSIARWNGSSWSLLGTGTTNGVNGVVYSLTAFDDGSGGGPSLFVGGDFSSAGGVPANRIARWNGRSWSSLGVGAQNGLNSWVLSLAGFDDGSGGGPALYVGGGFTTAGGATANGIARWDGTAWSPLVTGAANGVDGWVNAQMVYDGGWGDGPALYVGGLFTTAGGLPSNGIGAWGCVPSSNDASDAPQGATARRPHPMPRSQN